MLTRAAGFWLIAVLLVLVLCAASAPTPLYGVYQRLWGLPTFTLTSVAVIALAAITSVAVSRRLAAVSSPTPITGAS